MVKSIKNVYIDDRLADSFVIGAHDIPIKKEINVENGQKLVISTESDSSVFVEYLVLEK